MEQLENAQQTPATSQERREVQSQREQASAPPPDTNHSHPIRKDQEAHTTTHRGDER